MNKKIIVLVTVLFCLISTILVSLIGKVPEDDSTIRVNAIMFVDSSTEDGLCVENEEGFKVIYIERGTSEYQLEWLLNPSNPTDPSVTFQIVSGQDYASVTEEGLVTFTYEAAVTIKIYSNPLDFKSDVVIIDFKGNQGTVIDPDDNPFASK